MSLEDHALSLAGIRRLTRSVSLPAIAFNIPTFIHRLPHPLRRALRGIQRRIGQRPFQKAVRELHRRGIVLENCRALEVFGGSGELTTRDYASRVRTLEIWEIDPRFERYLSDTFLTARVKCVDSYAEIRATSQQYDFIGVDNPVRVHDGHYEHFDLFPDLLRVASDSAVIWLLVMPYCAAEFRDLWGWRFTAEHLRARAEFYSTATPEHVPIDRMVAAYKAIIEANGFTLDWYYVQPHTFSYHFLFLKVRKLMPQS